MNDKLQSIAKVTKSLPGSIFVIILVVLSFHVINLLITVKCKRESAYSVLSREQVQSMPKLQDTRVHHWSEVHKN